MTNFFTGLLVSRDIFNILIWIPASRANKLVYDTKDIDNTSLLYKQKLKLLKEESSELANICDNRRILFKQFVDPNFEPKERTLVSMLYLI